MSVATMPDPLRWLRPLVVTRREAIRWACILEATAPKPGNVHPGASFANLTYHHFVRAAGIAADCLDRSGRVTEHMLDTVRQTVAACETNVNLGIVLLLGPLVGADRQSTQEQIRLNDSKDWKTAVARQLDALDEADGRLVFHSIAEASAGGLGRVDSMDVHQKHDTIDLVGAMKMAADRDRIAMQYTSGFADVIDHVAPVLEESMQRANDVLHGICLAHLRLLAWAPDSLIARKHGSVVAEQVQTFARSLDPDDSESLVRLDRFLRDSEKRLNPGTTADLICAGLFLLLRTPVGGLAASGPMIKEG